MPIHPLPVLSEEEELKAIERLRPPKDVVVRFGYTRQIAELPYDGDQVLGCGTKLVIRTPRGTEIAEMLTTTCANAGCGKSVSRQQMLQYIENSGGKQYPFTTEGRVLRVANAEDLNEWSRLQNEKPRHIQLAREAVRRLDLPMKIVEVEPLLSRDRIVFYFASELRIDFRELVRQLARDLHVRVEMRQVGARDEARLVADYEKCGQHCCCKQFLKVLKPVSMRSAKVQKATLDPAKISGRCGRLMCCLRYEDETYEDLRKRLPHRNTRVMTDDGAGTVVNTQILTQLVLVELDSNLQRNAYPVENVEKLEGDAARAPLPPRERLGDGETPADRSHSPRGPRPEDRRRPDGPSGSSPHPETERMGEDQQPDRPTNQPARGPRRNDRPPTPRAEPPRPQPGRPLREQEVESREGEPADDMMSDGPEPGQPMDEPGSGDDLPMDTTSQQDQPSDAPPHEGGRRRRRRRRRGRGRRDGGPPGQGQGPTPPPDRPPGP